MLRTAPLRSAAQCRFLFRACGPLPILILHYLFFLRVREFQFQFLRVGERGIIIRSLARKSNMIQLFKFKLNFYFFSCAAACGPHRSGADRTHRTAPHRSSFKGVPSSNPKALKLRNMIEDLLRLLFNLNFSIRQWLRTPATESNSAAG